MQNLQSWSFRLFDKNSYCKALISLDLIDLAKRFLSSIDLSSSLRLFQRMPKLKIGCFFKIFISIRPYMIIIAISKIEITIYVIISNPERLDEKKINMTILTDILNTFS